MKMTWKMEFRDGFSALSIHLLSLLCLCVNFSLKRKCCSMLLLSFPKSQDNTTWKETQYHHDPGKIARCFCLVSNNAFHNLLWVVAWSAGCINSQGYYFAEENTDERCYYREINKVWEICDHTKCVVVNNVRSSLHLLLNSGIWCVLLRTLLCQLVSIHEDRGHWWYLEKLLAFQSAGNLCWLCLELFAVGWNQTLSLKVK